MVSYDYIISLSSLLRLVLILIVMDNGLLPCRGTEIALRYSVLILIVMDNGLLPIVTLDPNKGLKRLNPYCNG